jgi:hypothetical protein
LHAVLVPAVAYFPAVQGVGPEHGGHQFPAGQLLQAPELLAPEPEVVLPDVQQGQL